jgi:hypothetical protein
MLAAADSQVRWCCCRTSGKPESTKPLSAEDEVGNPEMLVRRRIMMRKRARLRVGFFIETRG